MFNPSLGNPVSLVQFTDSFNTGCIPKPEGYCSSFKSDLELFVKDYCKTRIDYTTLDKKCLTASSNQDLLQQIINKINCAAVSTAIPAAVADAINISGINFCSSDYWTCPDCLERDECIAPVDANGTVVTNYTLKQLLQAYAKRINALQNTLCQEKIYRKQLEDAVNNLTNEVNLIKANCCNVTVVSSIQALTSRVNSIDTQVQTQKDTITLIQETCCPA